MKKVAFVCAYPPTRNTGMATVDLSAHSLLRRWGIDCATSFYTLGDAAAVPYRPDKFPFQYESLHDRLEIVHEADAILLWGDFLQSAGYWRADLVPRLLRQNIATSQEQAENLVHRALLLEGAGDEVHRKTILFGGTTIIDSAKDVASRRYQENLKKLVSLAAGAYFRDAITAARMAPYRSADSTLGIDSAFLLRNEDLLKLPDFTQSEASDRRGIGIYFGRSPNLITQLVFARRVARRLRETPSWVSWLNTGRRRTPIVEAFGMRVKNGSSPGALLSQVARCRYVITDTYHLAINAWRLGIPVICLGEGAGANDSSLSDKKKEVLYRMYGAGPMYFYSENLCRPGLARRESERAAEILFDRKFTDTVFGLMMEHREASERRLVAALEKLVA